MISKFRRLFAWKNRILEGYTLWPTIVMLSYFLELWVFRYCDNEVIQILLFVILMIIFAPFCMIWALVSIIRKKPKSVVSFIFPALLVVFMLSPWGVPITHRFFDLRHYVEFQIQKSFYFPEMNDPDKLPPYKEWPLNKVRSSSEYTIIYNLKDSVDEIEKNKKGIKNGCGYSVTRVGKHFYILAEGCK